MRTMRPSSKSYAETLQDVIQDRAALKFHPNDKVPSIIERMLAHGTGAGGVVDGSDRLIGMVTEREIVRRVFSGNIAANVSENIEDVYEDKTAADMSAWDVMIPNPNVVHVRDNVEDALDVITFYGYRYMPVVTDGGRLAGIVDARELYKHVRERAKALLESKDSLLSYFMHHEAYGGGHTVPPGNENSFV